MNISDIFQKKKQQDTLGILTQCDLFPWFCSLLGFNQFKKSPVWLLQNLYKIQSLLCMFQNFIKT